jgi:hypothetical protein
MKRTGIRIVSLTLAAGVGLLCARPISAPLAVFESTKLPRRTLKDGPSIFGTLPFINESNLTREEKEEYKKMVAEVKERDKKNEKYRRSKAKTLQLFESTKIHRDPSLGPSPVREMFSDAFSAVNLGDDTPEEPKKTEKKK